MHVVRLGTGLAVAGVVHAAWNSRRLRVPPPDPPPVAEPVALLLPLRDEARRVEPCLRALLAQTGVRDLRVLVLDDGSTDGTADVVRRVAAPTHGSGWSTGQPLPAGWWGKPWACAQLAARRPPPSGGARLRRRRRGAGAARGGRVGGPAAVGRAGPGVALPAAAGRDPGRAAGAAAAAVVLADHAAAAGGRAVAPPVAGRGQRPAARRRRRRPTAGPAGTARCAPRCSRTWRCCARSRPPAGAAAWSTAPHWRPAGCTPGGRTCATATRSRCGRPSAPPRARPRWWRAGGCLRAAAAGGAARVPGRAGGLRRRGGRTGGRCPAYGIAGLAGLPRPPGVGGRLRRAGGHLGARAPGRHAHRARPPRRGPR